MNLIRLLNNYNANRIASIILCHNNNLKLNISKILIINWKISNTYNPYQKYNWKIYVGIIRLGVIVVRINLRLFN